MYKGHTFEEWAERLEMDLDVIVEFLRQGVDLEKLYLQKLGLLSED